jgi:hypothetical protein
MHAKPKVTDRFENGRCHHVRNSRECYKMINSHPILMKIGTHTKTDMLSLKIKSGSVRQKTAKIKCKKLYRFKKATLYEHKVMKKQKFFIRWQKLPYSYNMW